MEVILKSALSDYEAGLARTSGVGRGGFEKIPNRLFQLPAGDFESKQKRQGRGKRENVSMKTTTENNARVQHEDIAELAKQIWEREGRQAGRDLEYWLRAERQLRLRRNATGNPASGKSTTGTAQFHGTGKAIKLPDSVTKLVQST